MAHGMVYCLTTKKKRTMYYRDTKGTQQADA
jgi:hypothetical protein